MHVGSGKQAASAAKPVPLRSAATADDPRERLARAEALANLAIALVAQRQAAAPTRLSRCEQATAWARRVVDRLRTLPARLHRPPARTGGAESKAGMQRPAARGEPS
ncbi:hypothetical protein [Chelatococcus reniformis]|uniref:Uncharacterized protein n=1 Tax=Chelatococcus reniformis TaxID=1494448 RepID=A0A916U178_9HYPH|nr:hypothetical protein [Chelatococcus reniformis]GGC56602.1 hypothetical protein GCM10010994_14420 [Chelatococcus reniformis]